MVVLLCTGRASRCDSVGHGPRAAADPARQCDPGGGGQSNGWPSEQSRGIH